MFLPETSSSSSQLGSPLTPANPQVSDADVSTMQRILAAAAARPDLIPENFMAYVVDFIQANNLLIPIGQIVGFSQFTAQTTDSILSQGTTTSATYTDLSDEAGPTLSTLPDGMYLFLYVAALQASVGGHSANMSLSFNGVAPSDNDAIFSHETELVSCAGFTISTLKNGGNNTVEAKYRSGSAGDTTTAASRRLVALKFANA